MKLHEAILALDEAIAALRSAIPPTGGERTRIADRLSRHRDHLKSRDMAIVRAHEKARFVDRRDLGGAMASDMRRGR